MPRKREIHLSREEVFRLLKDTVGCDDGEADGIAKVVESFTFDMLDDLHFALNIIRKGKQG